jgi:hypothetical protein
LEAAEKRKEGRKDTGSEQGEVEHAGNFDVARNSWDILSVPRITVNIYYCIDSIRIGLQMEKAGRVRRQVFRLR